MAKKLKIIDRLLIGVLIIDEILDTTVGAGSRAYHSGKLGLWTPPNYKGTLLSQNIYRMLKTGHLEKRIVNGEPVLKITRGGRQRLKRNFSYFRMQGKKWDGKWRLVIFDISEKRKVKRETLRKKLLELGFGMWQRSIYISPYNWAEDMYEFLSEQRLLGEAYVLTAKHQLMGDEKELARKVWNLEKLEKKYEEIVEHLYKLKKSERGFSKFKKIAHQYCETLLEDPCLPRDLLPSNWYGYEARGLISNLVGKIA